MAAKKRNKAERESDLLAVSELYLKGWSHQSITDSINSRREYNLSRSQVTRDIQTIHERWRESYLSDFHEVQIRELARLDRLEVEYWGAWERSQRDAESIEDVDIEDAQRNDYAYSRKKRIEKRESRDGDARFLEGIARCIEQRCKILGLNAPKKVEIDWREEAKKSGYSEQEINEIYNSLVDKLVEVYERGEIDSDQESPPYLPSGLEN